MEGPAQPGADAGGTREGRAVRPEGVGGYEVGDCGVEDEEGGEKAEDVEEGEVGAGRAGVGRFGGGGGFWRGRVIVIVIVIVIGAGGGGGGGVGGAGGLGRGWRAGDVAGSEGWRCHGWVAWGGDYSGGD